jgi:hypothetical protein
MQCDVILRPQSKKSSTVNGSLLDNTTFNRTIEDEVRQVPSQQHGPRVAKEVFGRKNMTVV